MAPKLLSGCVDEGLEFTYEPFRPPSVCTIINPLKMPQESLLTDMTIKVDHAIKLMSVNCLALHCLKYLIGP